MRVKLKTLKRGRPRKRLKVLAADKGYDSKEKRAALRFPRYSPSMAKTSLENQEKHSVDPSKFLFLDFTSERCFAWYQRKYRRLVVRWERRKVYFDAFIDLATIHIWVHKILLVG